MSSFRSVGARKRSLSCFFGVETLAELVWEGWEPGLEYTRSLSLKSIHGKLQKLSFRSVRTQKLFIPVCVRKYVLTKYWLISVCKLQTSCVQVLQHTVSTDYPSEPRNIFFPSNHFSAGWESKTIFPVGSIAFWMTIECFHCIALFFAFPVWVCGHYRVRG